MRSRTPQSTILVVEDDEGLRSLIQKGLRREGFHTAGASIGAEAISWLDVNSADLMLLDLKLPDMTGQGLVSQLSQKEQDVPFVVITGTGDEHTAVDMMKQGAQDYLVKDGTLLEMLPPVIQQVLQRLEHEKRSRAVGLEQARFRAVMEHVDEAIFILDSETSAFIDINETACRWLGYSQEELLKLKFKDIVPASSFQLREQWGAYVWCLRRASHQMSFAHELFKHRDGSTLAVEMAITIEPFEAREYVVARVRRISQREWARQKLNTRANLLIIDNTKTFPSLESAFRASGFSVTAVADSSAAINRLQDDSYDILIINQSIFLSDGEDLPVALRRLTASPIIVMGSGEEEAVVRSLIEGADTHLLSSADVKTVLAYARALMRRNRTQEGVTGLASR
ncbi:MAG: response regulator [Dehalococcoidia bacterium]